MRFAVWLYFFASVSVSAEIPDSGKSAEIKAARQLRDMGGRTFLDPRTGQVKEVNLNGNQKIEDEGLDLVAKLPGITDLSLERTRIGDAGVASLSTLKKLEWLNLYRTRVTNEGLQSISKIGSLTHLPIGETKVSDTGLVHLAGHRRLQYLGLRENQVTDKGLRSIGKIKTLKGLHLGGTNVSDLGLDSILELAKLEELWLFDTAITNSGLKKLSRMKSLKRLHLQRTSTTAAAIKTLRTELPDCEIFWESNPE